MPPSAEPLRARVASVLRALPIVDVHTHLFDPAQADPAGRPLLLSGIDELLTYHYHVAELFRARPDLDPAAFWALPVGARADLVWRESFVERGPLSEVGRAVVHLLGALGLEPRAPDLGAARALFAGMPLRERVDLSFRHAGVRAVYMTNDPLDAAERASWERGFDRDPRFRAALRLDSAIMGWPEPVAALRGLGYDVDERLGGGTAAELARYLREWAARIDARYLAVSLPPRLGYPDDHEAWLRILVAAVIPAARELGLPVALMIGVRRQVNPELRLAGDSVGATDVDALERLAADFPDVRFLVTLLARESQHALCVAARKFKNLLPFGCWWFVNNPSLVAEITRMRLDLLGPTFVPQHSDARVLEQLVFKWQRSREWLIEPFAERYLDLERAGWGVTDDDVRRDLEAMLATDL